MKKNSPLHTKQKNAIKTLELAIRETGLPLTIPVAKHNTPVNEPYIEESCSINRKSGVFTHYCDPLNDSELSSFELNLYWSELQYDEITDIPDGSNGLYYTDDAFTNTNWYRSTYICPVCSIDEEDEVFTYALLWKLKIKNAFTEHGGLKLGLYNLFTCPTCGRFMASVDSVDDKKYRDENNLPVTLRECALISWPYSDSEWSSLVKEFATLE